MPGCSGFAAGALFFSILLLNAMSQG